MARGNLILGQGAGKLGDVVLFRNAGQQQARAYVSNPKNPKTYKQALQRSKFASVALAYQYFKTIIDRSTRYKNGRTAYNDFLKNNIAAAPYASKSERQEWAGLYSLPAQWTLAFGALARPEAWKPTPVAGTGSAISGLKFGKSSDICAQILNYYAANSWLPSNPTNGQEVTITATQLAEALAGATNCHVVLMTSGAAQVGEYTDNVAANGARILELTAENLAGALLEFAIRYTTTDGWVCVSAGEFTLNGAGGEFAFGVGDTSNPSESEDCELKSVSGATNGLIFATWIGNNSGTAVQVSNVICELAGSNVLATATKRRDESEAETDAAISSWQVEEAAGSDSAIY